MDSDKSVLVRLETEPKQLQVRRSDWCALAAM